MSIRRVSTRVNVQRPRLGIHAGATLASKADPQIYYYKGLSKSYPDAEQRKKIGSIISAGQKHAFHLTDLRATRDQLNKWRNTMKDVEPYYAMKCNDGETIVKDYAKLGAGFDCASTLEMKSALRMGVLPEKIILSNPCKNEEDIRFARTAGVKLMTFDSIEELIKIHEIYPQAQLLLRLSVYDKNAKIPLCFKAGSSENEWDELLQTAKALGLNIRGPMFHVGTGTSVDNSMAYDNGLADCWTIFNKAKKLGMRFDMIDIGGGQSDDYLGEIYETIARWKDKFPSHTKWVGEPGRLFAKPVQTVAVRVIGKKNGNITVDDGVHGSFSCVLQEQQVLSKDIPLNQRGDFTQRPVESGKMYGPTCCGLDEVSNDLQLPKDVQRGDWLVFGGLGAYTQVTRSSFNGMHQSVEKVLDVPEETQEATDLFSRWSLPRFLLSQST